MATEKQYAFFKDLYEEESKRTDELHEHAKNNLGLTTLYSAFVIFVVEKLKADGPVTRAAFFATIACMLVAFLLSLWATRVSVFEAVNVPADVLEEYGDDEPSDSDFFDDRIVDYTVAYERNAVVNNEKANQLIVARYCLLAGIALHAIYFAVRIG